LAIAGQRTGAIYLWGYAAEMLLKAAYFTFIGVPKLRSLTFPQDIQPAIARGRVLGIAWPAQGAGHNVRAWAELLVIVRAATPGGAFSARFGVQVQRCGQRISELWRETLRYHKNVAYEHEVDHVRGAVSWLLSHEQSL